ncbi:MAG: NupC/NupG family nucleoside CNT transporter [Myxococcales bacterium]|nr:NupC/NupG family nucleoside CNT transporter [Myxococcales bacterium]
MPMLFSSRSCRRTLRTLGIVLLCLLVPALAFADAPADVAQTSEGGSWLNRLQSVLGIAVMVGGAWWFREKREGQVFPTRVVVGGLGMQLLLGILILKTPIGEPIFSSVNDAFIALMGYSDQGAAFLFGDLVAKPGPGKHWWVASGAFVAFSVLPTIIFFSALMAVLYHLGVMIRIVRVFSRFIARALGTSGAETLSATGNIFVGQTEAPLLVRPFLATMTRSELNTVMVGGFATVAGGVMAAYVGMLHAKFPDIAGHLLAASLMSAPAALVIGKLMVPETETPKTGADATIEVESVYANVIEAAATGAADGLKLAFNVGAMLLAFIALIGLFNGVLSGLLGLVGLEAWTLERMLGVCMAPVAWLLGVDASEAAGVGSLLGVKTVLNEFVAYLNLADNLASPDALSERSRTIATYALCGFANFSSIGIQIGGISGIAPERKRELSVLGLRAMIGGTLGAFMTAALAGLLI